MSSVTDNNYWVQGTRQEISDLMLALADTTLETTRPNPVERHVIKIYFGSYWIAPLYISNSGYQKIQLPQDMPRLLEYLKPLLKPGKEHAFEVTRPQVEKVRLHRLKLDSQGYDEQGNYWGLYSPSAGRAYIAEAGPYYRRVIRAHNRKQAAELLSLKSEDLISRLR